MVKRVDKVDKIIFASLARAKRPLSIMQIVYRTGYSWITVNNHVKKMENWGTLDVFRSVRRTYVSINSYYLKRLRERRGY